MRRVRPVLGLDGLLLMRIDPRSGTFRVVKSIGVSAAACRLLEERPLRTIEEVLAGPWSEGGAISAVPVRWGRKSGCLAGIAGPNGGAQPDPRSLRVLGEALGACLAAVRPPAGGGGLRLLEHLKIRHRMSVLAAARRDTGEVGGRVLREFCAALRLTRGEIWLLGRRGNRLSRLCGYGPIPDPPRQEDLATRSFPMIGRLLRRRQPLLIPEAGGRPSGRYAPVDWPGLRGLYGVPLRRPGRRLGFLFADRGGQPIELSPADRQLASALAGLISEVVDNSLVREVERKRHRQLLLLDRANQAISAREDLGTLLPHLTRLVRRTEHCQGVVIGLYDTPAREIAVKALSGPGGRRLRTYRFPVRRSQPASCLGSQAFLRQRPIRVEDASRLPATSLYWPESRSVLVIPIRGKDRPLGVLRLEALHRRRFDEEDAKVYSILGEQIGHAVERALVLEELRGKQADLRRVSENLESMLEEDRRRVARELQDELAEALTVARLNLGRARDVAVARSPDLSLALHEVDLVLDQTIERTRRIAADLRPVMLDDLGLLPTLRWYTDAFHRRTGVRVSARVQGTEPVVSPEHGTILFRFVQDALGLVERAASASRALVSLGGTGSGLRMVIWDDGTVSRAAGARPEDGLLAMRERVERAGGTLQIDSRPGLGTRLVATVPPALPASAARARSRRAPRPEARHQGGGGAA